MAHDAKAVICGLSEMLGGGGVGHLTKEEVDTLLVSLQRNFFRHTRRFKTTHGEASGGDRYAFSGADLEVLVRLAGWGEDAKDDDKALATDEALATDADVRCEDQQRHPGVGGWVICRLKKGHRGNHRWAAISRYSPIQWPQRGDVSL